MSRALAIAGVALVTSAYAGSPEVFFSGHAGPYLLHVVVHMPGVIPGRAVITVTGSPEVEQVTVQPVVWDAGPDGAPPADPAARNPGSGAFHAELWLMTAGSYGVRVTAAGSRGVGTAVVPVSAAAYRRLGMSRSLAATLLSLATFLIAGVLTIVWTSARESALPPGEPPDSGRRRRAWMVTSAAGVVLGTAVVGGLAWWRAVDAGYAAKLYRPPYVTTSVQETPRDRVLTLTIRDSSWAARRARYPLILEEGKLMHLFLVRESSPGAFAHLHPARPGQWTFEARLPPLPAGRYLVFAEVVDSTGFAEIIPASVDLQAAAGIGAEPRPFDPDDSWWTPTDQQACAGSTAGAACRRLADGSTVTWERDDDLAFRLRLSASGSARSGEVLVLEPHGELVHVRPFGTMPLAALERFSAAPSLSSVDSGGVSFPYRLSEGGRYRLWVQVKEGRRMVMAVFDTVATPSAPRQ